MEKKKIVVVGAGYAGTLIAKKIHKKMKKLKKLDQVEITIIDKNPFHTMLTELHEVAASRVEEDSIKLSLDKIFAGRDVNVVLDTVDSVDYEKKQVVGKYSTYAFDHLVLATGSKQAFFGVPGAQENAFSLWSYEDAIKIRDHITNMFHEAASEPDIGKRRELLTFFVVGAGFTGVEMAGELAEYMPYLCDKFEIDPTIVSMNIVDMLDRACTVLPEKLSEKVARRLKKMRVNVMFKTNIKSVGPTEIEYTEGKTSNTVKTRTVIWTAGIEGSDLAQNSAELGAAGRGRIQTDEFLRSKKNKNVYIGGDIMFYVPEGDKNPVPQLVENCEQCADVIAHNLVCDITGEGQQESYSPKLHGVMVSVGGRYGVAHVGPSKHFFGLPSFLAMMSKHFINIIYFIQVLGWNKIFSYISHEFFTIRNKRSFVGGHFSNRSPSFFLVPLRMFLGFYWIYEGVKKIGEGWFQDPKLVSFFAGANSFYDSVVGTISGTAADAAAGASAAAAATGETAAAATGEAVSSAVSVMLNWNFFGWFRLLLLNATDVAVKFQIKLLDNFLDSFILPYDGMQMFFQVCIVLAEIAVGVALFCGLFTTVASVVSLVLQMMFLTTTGLYMASWWMLFGSFAMLFGGGRVFSSDYYVMPFIKRKWKNIKFIKKWYLYND